MVRHRGILYCMTVMLLTVIVFLFGIQGQKEILSFQISSSAHDQSITLWENEAGQYYVFLPSYAKMENVQIVLHTSNPVSINGVKLENGMGCISFAEGISYPFSYTAWGRNKQEEIIFLRSANVAAMYIETQSGSMNYIHADKGNKETGILTLYQPDGTVNYSGDLASIQGRGNYTWGASKKKPYSIKLTEEENLLNLGSAQKWILLANASDASHMQNKVVYDFADRVGLNYTPGSDWVDLYLNGEYAGLYLLSERNEVHPERIDIAEDGSFLVSMELSERLRAQKYPYISTATDQFLRVHYPEKPSSYQLQELEKSWQSVENAILAENDIDPVTGKTWMELIDLDSWVKKYLVEEIFGSIDACFISQFFYCDGSDAEGKVYAGPVWDYDIAMGAESIWQLNVPNILFANRYDVMDGVITPWFHTLYQKDIFYQRMVELYQSDFLPLLNGFLYEHISRCSKQIAQAYELDRIRWDLQETGVSEKAEYLQDFMRERIAFLNSIWIEKLPYHTVKVNSAGGKYGYYVFFFGEKLADLAAIESTGTGEFLGWYDSETGEPFDPSVPINEDVMIYAKWRPTPSLVELVRQILTVILLILFAIIVGSDLYRRRK